MDFDIELETRSMDNPVYYVQYAHARICRILEKQPLKADLAQFDGECGQQMMLLLLQYPMCCRNVPNSGLCSLWCNMCVT